MEPFEEKPIRPRLDIRLAVQAPHTDEEPDFDEEAFLQSLTKAAGAFFVVSLFGAITIEGATSEAPTTVFDNPAKTKFAAVEPTLAQQVAQNVSKTELFLFLTLDTPYRGCLVYAGAAAAIAAQCIKSTTPIVVVSKNVALKHAALKLALTAAALTAWEKKDGVWRRKAGPAGSLPLVDKQGISMVVRAEIDRVVFLDPSNAPANVDGKFVVLDDAHQLCRTVAQTKFYATLTSARNCQILAVAPAPTFDDGAQLSVLLNILRGQTTYYACKQAPKDDLLRTVFTCDEQGGLFYVVRTPDGYVNSEKGLTKGLVELDETAFKKKMGKCTLQVKLPFPEDLALLTPAEFQRRTQGLAVKTALDKWAPQILVHHVAPAAESGKFKDDQLLNAQGAFDSALKKYNSKFYAVLQEIKKSPLKTHLIVAADAARFEQVLRKNGYAHGEVSNYVYDDEPALEKLADDVTILLFSAMPKLHKRVDHAHLLQPINAQRVDCGALHYYLYKESADEAAYENLKKQAVVNSELFKLLL
jgi:hypothetical protein